MRNRAQNTVKAIQDEYCVNRTAILIQVHRNNPRGRTFRSITWKGAAHVANKCLAILIGMALSALLPANIQAQSGPAKGTPDRPWAVWKVGKDSAKIVANFAAERDAVAQASKWNAANPQPERFAYLTRRESSGGEVPSLQERRGQGQIGKFKVNVEFRAGEIAYSGELKGKAKWSQTDAGSVCIESARSAYFGLIDGDRVAGVWFVKDKSQPLTTWQFKLEPAPAAKAKTKTDGAVEAIAQGDVKAFSSEKGKAVIGVLPKDDDDGKIVTAVPGQDRVWDGKTLGGFKDLLDGKKVDDATALDRIGAFIREQDPQKNEALKESANDLRAKLLDLGEDPKDIEPKVAQKVRDQIRDYVDNAGPAQRQEWFDSYADRGAADADLPRLRAAPGAMVSDTGQQGRSPDRQELYAAAPCPCHARCPATDPPTPAVKPPARDTDLAGKIGKITIGYLPDYDHNGKFIGNTGKLTLPDKSNPSGAANSLSMKIHRRTPAERRRLQQDRKRPHHLRGEHRHLLPAARRHRKRPHHLLAEHRHLLPAARPHRNRRHLLRAVRRHRRRRRHRKQHRSDAAAAGENSFVFAAVIEFSTLAAVSAGATSRRAEPGTHLLADPASEKRRHQARRGHHHRLRESTASFPPTSPVPLTIRPKAS